MQIVFIGSGDIAVPVLERLITSDKHELAALVAQPDKPAGRKMELTPPPTKRVAAAANVPIFQPSRIRQPEAVAEIAALKPDVIVVMAYGQILPKSVLDIPRLACLNLHASILPKHRGAAPIHAAILAGDGETGITVMYMDEGLDTGDILLIRTLPIRRRETASSLHDRLAELSPGALCEALDLLEAGNAPRIPQADDAATYAKKLAREDGEIDWSAGNAAVDRLIRGMNAWPGAYTLIPIGPEVRKLKVYRAIRVRKMAGPPGRVLRADERGLLVGTGDGGILLRDVQLEGKRRMPCGEFLRGTSVPIGITLPHSQPGE